MIENKEVKIRIIFKDGLTVNYDSYDYDLPEGYSWGDVLTYVEDKTLSWAELQEITFERLTGLEPVSRGS